MIQSKAILLRTCKEVSLATFIECYCEDNFAGLGTGTQEELIEAWNELLFEWCELMRNEDSDHKIQVGFQILNLQKHITIVDGCVFALKRTYDKDLIEKLISLGYPGEYPDNNKEKLNKELDRAVSLCKTIVFNLWELQEEIERIEKVKDNKKSTSEDFERNIVRLSESQGYNIDAEKTTVFRYTCIYNNFIDKIKLSNSHNKEPDN